MLQPFTLQLPMFIHAQERLSLGKRPERERRTIGQSLPFLKFSFIACFSATNDTFRDYWMRGYLLPRLTVLPVICHMQLYGRDCIKGNGVLVVR